MARLRIEFSGASTVVPLARGETTVGRSNRCTIHLPDPRLGEIQFRIQPKEGGYRLKDDGSGIGTKVNGRPVFATALAHGDVIEAGALRCTFLAEEGVVAAPVAAPAPPVDRPVATARSVDAGHPRAKLLIGGGLGGVALLLVVMLLLREDPEKGASRLWVDALAALRESRERPEGAAASLERAKALLDGIVERYRETKTAGTAEVALKDVRRALDDLRTVARDRQALSGEVPDAESHFARLARMKDGAHPAVVLGIERIEEGLKRGLIAREESRFNDRAQRARALLSERRFADALALWRGFETDNYFYRRRAEDALSEIVKGISVQYRAILRLAGESGDIDARIGLLEANRPLFKGTEHFDDLEVRISALKARKNQPVVVAEAPVKPPVEKPPGEKPPPEEKGPYADPPAVADLVRARRYGEAAATLRGVSRHALAPVRIEELTLLANLMADLVAAIGARPADFTDVLLPDGKGRGEAVGADSRQLLLTRGGVEVRCAWEDVSPKSFVRLFRQAGFGKPPRLAIAVFFDEEAQPKEAEEAYLDFFRSEQAPTTLSRILARRRGIAEPAQGFLLFRERLMTAEERDRILLGEQIDKLAKESRTCSAKRRPEVWAELARLGAPATEALAHCIRDRRAAAAEELKAHKAFTGSRWAAKHGTDLTQRREAALKFILDATAYPYPNKSEEAQREAERLVDRVRELYERPYPLLLAGSEEGKAIDQEVRDLDERLARVDPLAEPIYEAVAEEITRRLDMRTVALDGRDQKRIDYNLAVERYNRTLPGTTADAEERANVDAVNAYRWMMGLESVKLDERLVRAARKHSIEMKQLNYFEHDSPTASLKSPSQRARREGYGGGVSENIARGASTGVEAFVQWFRSSGHHRNMLLGHTDLGCGACDHHWWTQNFGSASGKSLSPPQVPPDPDPPGESGNGLPAPK